MAGWFTGIEDEHGYRPPVFHRFFRGRISGKEINGLGETRRRRPRPVYHDQSRWHPWRIVHAFYLRVSLRGFWRFVMASDRLDRRRPAPVPSLRMDDTPERWSARVKEAAIEIGADDVGIARMDAERVFEGESVPEPWIVVLASRMGYERLAATMRRDFRTGLGTVMETYYRGHETAVKLADWIRAHGWPAKGYGSPRRTPVNLVPAAIAAGLGELGKHGSLIHPGLGGSAPNEPIPLSGGTSDTESIPAALPLLSRGADPPAGDRRAPAGLISAIPHRIRGRQDFHPSFR